MAEDRRRRYSFGDHEGQLEDVLLEDVDFAAEYLSNKQNFKRMVTMFEQCWNLMLGISGKISYNCVSNRNELAICS